MGLCRRVGSSAGSSMHNAVKGWPKIPVATLRGTVLGKEERVFGDERNHLPVGKSARHCRKSELRQFMYSAKFRPKYVWV